MLNTILMSIGVLLIVAGGIGTIAGFIKLKAGDKVSFMLQIFMLAIGIMLVIKGIK